MSPKVQSFASVCNHWFTMASADFSPFVVTDGFHTLFPSADETSLGTTRHFLSIYLPHLPHGIRAALDFVLSSTLVRPCTAYYVISVRRFRSLPASIFFPADIRLPSDSTSQWTPLGLAVSFPLLGQIRNLPPLATCATRRTTKIAP